MEIDNLTEIWNSSEDWSFERNLTYNFTNETCEPFAHSPSPLFQAVIYLMYSCIFILALVGNGLVVGVIFSTRRKWTVTNYFIINLAVSDILMAVACIPFSFVSTLILQHWPFGGLMCRVVHYSQVVSVFVSAYTMVVISADRYFSIIYPLRPRMTRRQAKVVMIVCWLLALMIAMPIAVLSELEFPSERHEKCNLVVCSDIWDDPLHKYYYSMTLLAAQYVLPLSLILFSYGRIGFELWGKRVPGEANAARDRRIAASKRKMIKMMITVVVVFAVCWFPLNALMLVLDIWYDINLWSGISYVWFICHWIAMSHSSYNPFIYCCYHAGFRQGLASLAYRCGCRSCFPAAESFDGMDAETLQRANTCTSYVSRSSSLRFHRGSTLRPLLSQTSVRGHAYGARNGQSSFRASTRYSECSEIIPVTNGSPKEESGICKMVFRSKLKRGSDSKVEMQVFSEKEAI